MSVFLGGEAPSAEAGSGSGPVDVVEERAGVGQGEVLGEVALSFLAGSAVEAHVEDDHSRFLLAPGRSLLVQAAAKRGQLRPQLTDRSVQVRQQVGRGTGELGAAGRFAARGLALAILLARGGI